ncbi:MAG: redoxin domain-containing protein [Pirellulaceae bacterium]|jgi:peroxiredoxin|nr:redoxin domain-containing protein [Pirellulaceae bacterium]
MVATFCVICLAAIAAPAVGNSAPSVSPLDETYWTLLHDDTVVADLALSAPKQAAFRAALDPLDLRLFPLRNRPAAEAAAGLNQIVADTRQAMQQVLTTQQAARLDKIVARQLGVRWVQLAPVRRELAVTSEQQASIDEAVERGQQALAKLRAESTGKSPEELNQAGLAILNRQRDEVLAILSTAQKRQWGSQIAGDFDVAKIGQTRFKVPELISAPDQWRNSPPLSLAELRGKVVVVHFFACGCINCIHNYPVYRQLQDEFAGREVVMIGIHTPETKTEREVAHLEKKLKQDELTFPLLIDNDRANWNAWGNSMWPSVYIVDKQGYLRHFWPGELKWQGAKGDEVARQWIERLLAEKPEP